MADNDNDRSTRGAEEEDIVPRFQHLLEVLLRNIFLRLPVSIIGGMRRLCSSFRACIHEPDFATAHLNGHKADSYEGEEGTPIIRIERSVPGYISCMRELYFASDGVTLTQSTIANIPVGGFDLKVAGTANGLVVLQKIEGHPYNFSTWKETQLMIWNPVLGNRFVIPQSPLQLGVLPDPQLSKQVLRWRLQGLEANVGFLYDSQTEDYKVVVFLGESGSGLSVYQRSWVEVYNVRTNSWESNYLDYIGRGVWGHKVCHGRSIHWILRSYSAHRLSNSYSMVSFNLDTCSRNIIEVPDTDGMEVKFPVLYNGLPAVFSVARLDTMLHVLKKTGEWAAEWEQHILLLSSHRKRFVAFLKSGRISNAIFFPEQKCILISLDGCGLLSYNFITNKLRLIDDTTTYVDTYIGSFVRLLPQ